MDWDDLRYVLAVARGRSLTVAAANLGVSRTTVGRRLKATEERLGVKLFDRTPEGWLPTPAANDLATTAANVEAEIQQTEGRVLGRDAELRGPLRIATLLPLFDGFTGIFTTFVEQHPGVTLTICAGARVVSLTRREADVALRPGQRAAGSPDRTQVGPSGLRALRQPRALRVYGARRRARGLPMAPPRRAVLHGLDGSLARGERPRSARGAPLR